MWVVIRTAISFAARAPTEQCRQGLSGSRGQRELLSDFFIRFIAVILKGRGHVPAPLGPARTESSRARAHSHAHRRPLQRISRLRVEVLEDRRLLSVTPSLLADIAVDSSFPGGFTEANGVTLFTANDGTHGKELWKTDGTAEGTVLVKDISPGGGNSSPVRMTNVNETVFFFANDGSHTNLLWKSDGTEEGTVLVKAISSTPNRMTNVSGTLFFALNRELWKSDGTEAGTVLLKEFASAFAVSGLTNTSGTLFFTANDGIHSRELWKSDGTEEGTVLVKDIRASGSSDPLSLHDVNGTLFFTANDGIHGRELWKSDGSEEGTVLVKDIAPGSASSGFTSDLPANVNGTLFFAANDGTNGKELWKSDGTAEGTVQVKDVNPGDGSSLPSRFATFSNVDGTLFFWANDGTDGYAVWKSDGSHEGTVLVKDIFQGDDDSLLPLFSGGFTSFDGEAFFTANDGTDGYELWKSDGTEQGTVLVKDIAPGVSSGASTLANVGGTLFFRGNDGVHEGELWKSDGTEAGTVMVKDINPNTTASSRPHSFTAVGNLTFFVAGQPSSGSELWRTDGTQAGTFLVKDASPGAFNSEPRFLTNVDGVLYFTAWDARGWEPLSPFPPIALFKSDGTAEGTVRVKEIIPSGRDTFELRRSLINANGTLFFNVEREVRLGRTVNELWTSDGTEEGTVVIAERGWYPTDVNGTVFFSGSGRLWKTDGTEEGTVLVHPGGILVNRLFGNVNGTLFFSGAEATHGFELWKSDGTEEGTIMVKDINPDASSSVRRSYESIVVDGVLYFRANDGTNGYELWKSDGTEEGTILVKDIGPGSVGSYPTLLTNVAGTLFFQANDGTHGHEWWKTDGTEAGTVLLKDINPGPAGSTASFSYPDGPFTAAVDGTFYFAADVGSGNALWMSDGTEAGTVQVDDGGIPLSNVAQLANANGILYFSADDGTHGSEPWIIAPDVVPSLLDIKPGSDLNSINLGSKGVLPVAILTTDDFDVTTVDTSDLSTIQFGDPDVVPRVSPLRTALEDVDGDGDTDLILHFSIREIRNSGALLPVSTQALLMAVTTDGDPIAGIDSVRIVPKKDRGASPSSAVASALTIPSLPERPHNRSSITTRPSSIESRGDATANFFQHVGEAGSPRAKALSTAMDDADDALGLDDDFLESLLLNLRPG